MTKHLYLFVFFFCSFCGIGQESQLFDICSNRDSSAYTIVDVEDLFLERWDTLAQPIFWKKIMKLSPDTCIINIAESREILCYESTELWSSQSSDQKLAYKDSLKLLYCLDDETKIFVTSGKKDFYLVNKTMPSISKAVNVFDACKVDPWYAQAILLIESPKKLEYSNAGAYGPFQLMKSVARAHGLVVNKTTDERKDFEKSAKAAASLLSKVCVPEAKRILNSLEVEFSENKLWFKLLVLHIYHAGAGNVEGLLKQQETPLSGKNLITWIWKNEWGGFKNASQNYTQVAIAALLSLQDEIYEHCDFIFECRPF
ncbi:MAG: transglycosylase SLT domain-containing protein [Parvicellaceae bacterium]